MDFLFSVPGSYQSVTLFVFAIHIVSLLIMLLLLLEFRYLHNKRIVLLRALGSSHIQKLLVSGAMFMIFYVVLTLGIIFVSSSVYST